MNNTQDQKYSYDSKLWGLREYEEFVLILFMVHYLFITPCNPSIAMCISRGFPVSAYQNSNCIFRVRNGSKAMYVAVSQHHLETCCGHNSK